ncbi:hypothetical protein TA3x_002278 [Tundrisphaera sp. TA3]|uniref:hypothetical protein n=1 Tax=Tundrisphaera sp. TA3 TaxID=3435775 RepID=UPI003EB797A5
MRLCQYLMSPEPEAGGGPAVDEVVTIARAELDALQALAAKAAEAARITEERAEDAKVQLMARDAAHARELAARDQRSADLERSYRSALRDREIAAALVGKPLIPGAASQLMQLWRDDFDVIDDGGQVRILGRDGRAVEQVIADRLGGPEFAHFCVPTSRGGTGARGQNRSASPAQPPPGPRSLGEAAVMRWQVAASAEGIHERAGWGRR